MQREISAVRIFPVWIVSVTSTFPRRLRPSPTKLPSASPFTLFAGVFVGLGTTSVGIVVGSAVGGFGATVVVGLIADVDVRSLAGGILDAVGTTRGGVGGDGDPGIGVAFPDASACAICLATGSVRT